MIERLSAAESSLASFKRTLNLDVTADDLSVQNEISNLRAHKAMISSTRTKLAVHQSDGDVLAAIDAMHDDLETAKNTIANDSPAVLKSIREILDLSPHRDVCEYLTEMKKRSDKSTSIVKGAKKQLEIAPSDSNVVGAIAHWVERANDAELIVSKARKLLALDPTGGDIPSAIRSLKNKLSSVEEDRDLARKTFALTPSVELKPAVNHIKKRLETAENNVISLIGSVRKLLAPNDAPSLQDMTSVVLARHNTTTTPLRDRGSVLNPPMWSLEITSVPVSVDSLEKRMERLKVLTVFDAGVSTCLEEVEGMLAQVEQCTHNNLDTISTILHAYWQTNGLVKIVNGQLSVVPAANPQSRLHALLEARLLEFMVRGTSVLRCGWIDVQEAIQNVWMVVNQSTIEENLVLQAYRAWFNSLDQPVPLSLPQMLYDIVMTSDPTLSCQEVSGGRVLIANILSNGYCFLWQVGEHRASMYAVSDLQHYLASSTTVFPERRRAPGVVVADHEFTEPLFARFVMNQMSSLHVRGLTGRRHV